MNITVDIDDQVAEKVSKIAIEKDTTLTAMVQEYLTSLADNTPVLDAADGKEAADKFRESVRQLSRPMGPRNWTRDDLYDRPYVYFKRD